MMLPPSASEETPEPNSEDTRSTYKDPQSVAASPLNLLFSESEGEGDIRRVTVTDRGSRPQLSRVDVQGVPAD
jgi:hypothetical protein